MCPTAPALVNQGVAIFAGHDPSVSAPTAPTTPALRFSGPALRPDDHQYNLVSCVLFLFCTEGHTHTHTTHPARIHAHYNKVEFMRHWHFSTVWSFGKLQCGIIVIDQLKALVKPEFWAPLFRTAQEKWKRKTGVPGRRIRVCVFITVVLYKRWVCVYYCSTCYKAVRVGGNNGGHVLRETTSGYLFRTGGSSIKKIYKGHSQDPPTLVVKCKETLSRDVTWLRSDAFKKISCRAGLFKMQRFEIF
jgi:hypothetical protein